MEKKFKTGGKCKCSPVIIGPWPDYEKVIRRTAHYVWITIMGNEKLIRKMLIRIENGNEMAFAYNGGQIYKYSPM